MLETVKTLCCLSGVSGSEDEVRDYILECATHHADRLMTDALGNLIALKKGARSGGPRVMLCAHMDEVGLIITDMDDEGYLRFDAVGGIDRRVLPGKRLYIGSRRVPGVIGCRAVHLAEKKDAPPPQIADMYIDIGASDREQARALVDLGDAVVFDDRISVFGAGFIRAKALDDRVGCAAMLKLMERELPCDVYFAFTTQEEVGVRGATAAAFRVAPEIALVLEGTTAADLPDVGPSQDICRLGGGVVIPFMDKGSIYDRGLFALLTRLADGAKLPWQTKRRIAGGTDAQAIQRSASGTRVAALSCPVRNIHSPAGVAKISDFESMPELACRFLEAVCRGSEA